MIGIISNFFLDLRIFFQFPFYFCEDKTIFCMQISGYQRQFDATVITLVDEGAAPLIEDVAIHAFEDCITVEQLDPRTDRVMRVTLSLAQARDLAAALNLPEGIYRRAELGKARP